MSQTVQHPNPTPSTPSWRGRVVLVTGGGGFLGRHIVTQLLVRGATVRSLSRRDYADLRTLGVETVQADLQDLDAVRLACEGVDVLFHTAALPGVWGPRALYYGINTQGTLNILEGCHRAGVKHLIYTSSPSVVYDGQPHLDADESLPYPATYLCHYPETKALAEQAVLAANGIDGLTTTALRPHLIWGPGDNHLIPRLIQRAKTGRLRRVGDGTNLVSMSYVENAAAAHLQAADRLLSAASAETPSATPAGRAYFINEAEPVRLWEWVDTLLQLAGLPPVKKSVSARTARVIGRLMEGAYHLFRLSGEPMMTRFVASQLSQSHTYSIAAAQRDFGYAPPVTVAEGMHRLSPLLQSLANK
ncbi:MAG: NAD-dependent epimerase/dehydratase family protein [Planctomycetaceae bacterium]